MAKDPEIHWTADTIVKKYPVLKGFLAHIAFLVVGALAVFILYATFLIPGKDAENSSLRQEKERLSTELQRQDRENDKLRNENALYRAGHDEKNFPLKRRVQIIVRQINEFADLAESGKIDQTRRMNEWGSRFEPRINVLVGQLDEQGQHSEKLAEPQDFNRWINQFPAYIREIASELKKMGDKLPDE